ncbi:MAG TPA: hypothetical protein VD886_16915, partial [Herpetosiphonaceae bacterium]|nr:hypothetical protein [Herpetosiphonaceae bacterium]
MNPSIDRLYDSILAAGQAGSDRFYAALRARGIAPTPNPARNEHNLYAPNPVLLDGALVRAMTRDANAFCRALREQAGDAASLLARAPEHVARNYASAAVAERLLADHRRAHPLVCLDAFLVAGPDGLRPAYLEWQTVGTYVTMGMQLVEA